MATIAITVSKKPWPAAPRGAAGARAGFAKNLGKRGLKNSFPYSIKLTLPKWRKWND
jgi:hypothetical protein